MGNTSLLRQLAQKPITNPGVLDTLVLVAASDLKTVLLTSGNITVI